MTGNAEDGWLLQVERYINAKPETVWQIMTERQEEWWCPKPWRTEIIEQDWRAGGRSAMIMHGPDGETSPQEGVFLEVLAGRRFVSTDAFSVGWIPKGPFMVGFWEVIPQGEGSLYRAGSRHWNEETMRQHDAMGFVEGWGVCADQLKALCEAGDAVV